MSFAPDDKVTLLINTQSHGTVLKSDEANTLVRLDRLSFGNYIVNSLRGRK